MNLSIGKVGNFMVPNAYFKNIFEIDYKKLKKIGIKNIIFDVDNTLISYTEKELKEEYRKFIINLKKDFNIIIMSNSLSERVLEIVKDLDVKAYYSSMKPLKKNYKKILNKYNKEECVFIGDQFMTDILGAKRMKCKVILVDRISNKEPIYTKFWRVLEFFVIKILKRKNKFKKYQYYDNLN